VAPASGRGRRGGRGGVGGGEGGGVAVGGGRAHGLGGEGLLRRRGRAHGLRVLVLGGRLRLRLPAVRHRGRGGGTVALRRGRCVRMFYSSADVMRFGGRLEFCLDSTRGATRIYYSTKFQKRTKSYWWYQPESYSWANAIQKSTPSLIQNNFLKIDLKII
jgi:hypothetical protein